MAKKEHQQVVLEAIDFECGACGSRFAQEQSRIDDLLETKMTICKGCGGHLSLDEENEKNLRGVLKKKALFGKVMMAFMLLYCLIGVVVSFLYGGMGFIALMAVGVAIFFGVKTTFDDSKDSAIVLSEMS